jgi:hypothetical protein
MSYVKPTAVQADWAQKRQPSVFRQLAETHAVATEGFRVAAQNPELDLEQVLDAVGAWRAARETLRDGTVYATGLAIMAGAPSAPASRRLRMGREQLQRHLHAHFGTKLVLPPVRKRRAA